MHHEMSLRPGPFAKIADGSKRYELRLHDEKRRLISVGDTITFTCTADERRVQVRVTGLLPYPDFAALYAALPMTECGYAPGQVADHRDMEAYYPPEKQATYGVLAIQVERIRLLIGELPGEFAVRELSTADVPEMLRVARSNPYFYRYMRPDPDETNLAADLTALPPRRTLADKHFFGWFIVDGARQGKGLGRQLVNDVLAMLKSQGVAEVRLGRIEGNPQSEHFWHVCGFAENGLGYDTDGYHVVILAKTL